MKTVIILNGPAGCGKDTIANAIVSSMRNAIKCEFKAALRDKAAAVFDISTKRLQELLDNRETKELKTSELKGFSPRGALIHTSEAVYKPIHGSDYFGKFAAKSIAESTESNLFIFSDGGFIEEVNSIKDCIDNTVIIRLYRDDFSFSGDSRSYLHSDKIKSFNVLLLDEQEGLAIAEVKCILNNLIGDK